MASSSIKKASAEIHIPGFKVKIGRNVLAFYKAVEKAGGKGYKYVLPVPGRVKIAAGGSVKASLLARKKVKKLKHQNPYVAYMDHKKTRGPLVVRSWEKGDKLRPLGLKGNKKIQDIFVDRKVDAQEKALISIIADRKKIVWVAGYRIDDGVKVDAGTSRVIKLEYLRVKA